MNKTTVAMLLLDQNITLLIKIIIKKLTNHLFTFLYSSCNTVPEIKTKITELVPLGSKIIIITKKGVINGKYDR
ncbi:hypothetical protein CJF42_11740 [Pseudoalteromonas sp. NBT06-2]|nr:hypothetical protein CJF42_11740 [Pseudoalteromonas sp. NBT06-2]